QTYQRMLLSPPVRCSKECHLRHRLLLTESVYIGSGVLASYRAGERRAPQSAAGHQQGCQQTLRYIHDTSQAVALSHYAGPAGQNECLPFRASAENGPVAVGLPVAVAGSDSSA